jgi:hypothetical protein
MVPIVKFIYTCQMNEWAMSTGEFRLLNENWNTRREKSIPTVLPQMVCEKRNLEGCVCVCVCVYTCVVFVFVFVRVRVFSVCVRVCVCVFQICMSLG